MANTTNGVLSGSFTATGNSDVIHLHGSYACAVSGTFVGTVELQRYDAINNQWAVVTNGSFTTPEARRGLEPVNGSRYRVSCAAYTSGTIYYSVEQGSNALFAA